jgi:hypothetical protein
VQETGEGEARRYKVFFGHTRRREVPMDIWEALDQKVKWLEIGGCKPPASGKSGGGGFLFQAAIATVHKTPGYSQVV